MSPVPTTQEAPALPSPLQPAPPPTSPPQQQSVQSIIQQAGSMLPDFDDILNRKYNEIVIDFRNNPKAEPVTAKDRKEFIEQAYLYTDALIFGGGRTLSDGESKVRALTKVFCKVLAEESWSEAWIRPEDVERKLSRFEMHKDSKVLAAEYKLHTPQDAIRAAREAQQKVKDLPKDNKTPRGPYDDIEVVFVPGTVSAAATASINRDTTYPVSVSSVANVLLTHPCRDMTRPCAMARKFVECQDIEELRGLRKFACDVCDFAPHLLDNDNASLLIILLILPRAEICKRFDDMGIRIEGSTISHRRSECVKNKMGWKNSEERKHFDNVALELQSRIKAACGGPNRVHRYTPRTPKYVTSDTSRPSSRNGIDGIHNHNGFNGTPGPNGYMPPPIGLFTPQIGANSHKQPPIGMFAPNGRVNGHNQQFPGGMVTPQNGYINHNHNHNHKQLKDGVPTPTGVNGGSGQKQPPIGMFTPPAPPSSAHSGFNPVNRISPVNGHTPANSSLNVGQRRSSRGTPALVSQKAAGKQPVRKDEDAMDTS
ncbi:unnamed protein product [Periconia digitata]|uniref:Uncharacterized protein n=1 Tax=Periconia digitata TaxID=1303443 RepID=A0A9W4XMX9_9PLEO|nr:unnamed protein product [Periconia digitata]